MSIRQVFLLLTLPIFLSACFHSSDDSVALKIEAESHLIWELEKPHQFDAYVVDSEGQKIANQPDIEWSSSDESIATVDANGIVTAHKEGNVSIVATTKSYQEQIDIVVDTAMVTMDFQLYYEDRISDGIRFTTSKNKPIRFIKVEFVNEGKHYITDVYSDGDGRLSATIPKNGDVSIRVISALKTTNTKLLVQDLEGSYFMVYKPLDTSATGVVDVSISLETGVSGVFNVLDTFLVASDFVHSYNSSAEIDLNTYWEPDNYSGTFYCSNANDPACVNGEGIYVLSITNDDTDEYDDDVLLHEYGHYVASLLSRDDSPGGCHYFDSNDLDLSLSWSEGWGDFFPMAVKSWAEEQGKRSAYLSITDSLPLSHYMDTSADVAQLSFDIAKLENQEPVQIDKDTSVAFDAFHVYASSELAVNKILWDTLSSTSFGMQSIWSVFDDYLPGLASSTPINLETFWDGVVGSQLTSGELSEFEQIFADRKVYYQLDQFEGDDDLASAGSLALNAEQTHYIYSGTDTGDLDVIAFDVVAGERYEVLTKGLTSGADTYMRILDSNGSVVIVDGIKLQNDDWRPRSEYEFAVTGCGIVVSNNATALSSRVEFVAPQTTTYYIEVQSTSNIDPEPLPSAGRYGTYDITFGKVL